MDDETMGWAVMIDAVTAEPVPDDAVDLMVDELGQAVAVAEHRWSTTVSVQALDPLTASIEGLDRVKKVASNAGMPNWWPVAVEVITFDEQDRRVSEPSSPELVGVSEIADILDVSRQRASALQTAPGFPAPLATLKAGPVWAKAAVAGWAENWGRRPGHPSRAEPPERRRVPSVPAVEPWPLRDLAATVLLIVASLRRFENNETLQRFRQAVLDAGKTEAGWAELEQQLRVQRAPFTVAVRAATERAGMSPSPDTADACRQARDVLAIVEQPTTAQVEGSRHSHVLLAMAAMARCRALLRSIVHLVDVGRADTIGIETRALLEVWYFGVIALLGEQVDLDRFEADHRYRKNDLAKRIGQTLEMGPSRQFSVWERAKRADQLLSTIDGPSTTAVDLYRQLFSGESLLNAHAGLQSLSNYAYEDNDGVIGIELEPEINGPYVYGQVRIATVLTGLLAKWAYEHAGVDASAFDEIVGLAEV